VPNGTCRGAPRKGGPFFVAFAIATLVLIASAALGAVVWPVKSCPRCIDLRAFSCPIVSPGLTRIAWVDGLLDRLADGAYTGPGEFTGRKACRLCRGRGKVGLLRR
jgi:hypothetical protein